MDYTEALMAIRIADERMFYMDPRHLGSQINLVKAPFAGCPYCFGENTVMAVHGTGQGAAGRGRSECPGQETRTTQDRRASDGPGSAASSRTTSRRCSDLADLVN